LTNFPVITPTTSNGLVVCSTALDTGPGFSVTSPSGAVFNYCTYTGEIDADNNDNGDLMAHYYNPNTSAIDWNWTMSAQNPNNAFTLAAAFKAA
jgi:hypothetical protein